MIGSQENPKVEREHYQASVKAWWGVVAYAVVTQLHVLWNNGEN